MHCPKCKLGEVLLSGRSAIVIPVKDDGAPDWSVAVVCERLNFQVTSVECDFCFARFKWNAATDRVELVLLP